MATHYNLELKMIEYVKQKLNSGQFNDGAIVKLTGVSRFHLNKIRNDKPVKDYILVALDTYFRNLHLW